MKMIQTKGAAKNLPRITIAICSYNGSSTVERAINSLQSLNYPKEKIELFLVDDGSTDRTARIAKSNGLKVYAHEKNLGLAAARNTALSHATGDMFVSFDDDLSVDKNWLSVLVYMFAKNKDRNILGVCGRIENVGSSIVAQYFAASGHGMPATLKMNIDQSLLKRFIAYILARLRGPQALKNGEEVRELPGGNAIFMTDYLKKIGGWDAELKNAAEDNDLCKRLKKLNKNGVFLYDEAALIYHRDTLSLQQFIFRAKGRGRITAQYYHKHNVLPPLFPFPFAVFIVIAVAICLASAWTFLLIVCSPPIVYFWWLFRAFKEKKPTLISFSYIEFSEQLLSDLGIMQYILQPSNIYRRIVNLWQ